MSPLELPKTVQQAWGTEIAKDFTVWLAEQFSAAGLVPHIQVSAFVARQKVNILVSRRVSNLLLAGEPTLVHSTGSGQAHSVRFTSGQAQTPTEDWVWRVPVELTFPSHGRVGRVGEVEVGARYGEVRYTVALLAQMVDEADRLAESVLAPDA